MMTEDEYFHHIDILNALTMDRGGLCTQSGVWDFNRIISELQEFSRFPIGVIKNRTFNATAMYHNDQGYIAFYSGLISRIYAATVA